MTRPGPRMARLHLPPHAMKGDSDMWIVYAWIVLSVVAGPVVARMIAVGMARDTGLHRPR